MSIYGCSDIGARAYRRVYFSGSLGTVPPATKQIFQRDTTSGSLFGKGAGLVPISMTPTQTVNLLEYRLRDAATPTNVLSAYSPVAATPLIVNTHTTVTLTLPARQGWYYLDLRPNGENSGVVTLGPFGVGEVIAAAGQSLACDFWGTSENGDGTSTLISNFVSPSPNSACLAAWDSGSLPNSTTAWQTPSDSGPYTSTFAAEFLRLAGPVTGVNCGLVGFAYQGTYMAQWLAGATGIGSPAVVLNASLKNVLTAAGGKFGTFIWCQGHNDARLGGVGFGQETPLATYTSQLSAFIADIATSFGTKTFKRLISSIPSITTDASAKYGAGWVNKIRAAQQSYVSGDPLATEVDGLDVAIGGSTAAGVHPSQAGNVTFARHFYRAFSGGLGISPAGDRGPVFTGNATRAANNAAIVLPVTQAGGTAFVGVGTLTTQFVVCVSPSSFNDAGAPSSLAFPISSVDISNPAQIIINLVSVPSGTTALDVWYRPPFDAINGTISSGIYDNNTAESGTDGLTVGRQLMMTNAAVAITAPAPIPATITGSAAIQNLAGTFTVNLAGNLTGAWAVLSPAIGGTNGVDEGSRVQITGSGTVSLTPRYYGNYVARVYTTSTGGTPIATSSAFTVAPATQPTALSSPIVWLDAGNAPSIFADIALSNVESTNFGGVQGWADMSGNGHSVYQPSATLAPQLVLNRRNGLPGLKFSGNTGQFLQQLAGASWMSTLMSGNLTCARCI